MLKTLYQIDSFVVKSMSGFINHYCLMRSFLCDFLVSLEQSKVLDFLLLRKLLISSLSSLKDKDLEAFDSFFLYVTKKIATNYSKLDFHEV